MTVSCVRAQLYSWPTD